MPEQPSPRSEDSASSTPVEAAAEFLRQETTGGKILLGATAVALMWANVFGDSYRALWETQTSFLPHVLHLDIKLKDWAAGGLLAIFSSSPASRSSVN